jgi:hypothetical protein
MYSGRFAAFDDNDMKTQLGDKVVWLHARNPRGVPNDEGAEWGRIVQRSAAREEPDPYSMFGSGMTEQRAAQSHQITVY